MKDVYVVEWDEWEEGYGSKPSCTSYHLTENDMDEFILKMVSDFDESYSNDVASINVVAQSKIDNKLLSRLYYQKTVVVDNGQ